MKNTTLTMSFNTERLDALTYHMGKKEADLQEELKTISRSSMRNMYPRRPGNTWTTGSRERKMPDPSARTGREMGLPRRQSRNFRAFFLSVEKKCGQEVTSVQLTQRM